MSVSGEDAGVGRPADPEPRLLAYLIDQALLWVLAAAAAVLVGRGSGRAGAAVVTFVVALVLLVGADALAIGRFGATPGKAALGLRVVSPGGRYVGVRPALVRTALLLVAGLPTLGLGAAALAWTALTDPSGARRGLHDRMADTLVVDRRAPVPDPAEPEPEQLVNLTALGIVPDPGSAPPAEGAPRWRVAVDGAAPVLVDAALLLENARLGVAPDGALVVRDDGVAGGVTLVRDGHARVLTPGRASTLRDGDVVHLGGRTIAVTRTETA